MEFTLVLPFRLPTWNQLLAMNHWQRAKVTAFIRGFVSTSIRDAGDWRTRTEFRLKPRLTALQREAYLQMIQPNSSKKYRFRKRLGKMRKR